MAGIVLKILFGSPSTGLLNTAFLSKFASLDATLKQSGGDPSVALPPAQWFTQLLDHYDPTNLSTWQQKYYVNDTFYKPNGPIFLYIGGEGPLAARAVVDLQISVYAQQHDALVVALEHRFYGESAPLPDLSVASLKYLNAQQALADLAYFRQAIDTKYGGNNKWICFGGSYPGALSAWFRIKYPQLVVGAVASSAPVRAKLDFLEYLQVVQQSLLANGSQQCVANVAAGMTALQNMMLTSDGRQQAQALFKACGAIVTQNDVYTFISDVAGNFMQVVQYDAEIAGQPLISDLCAIMTAASDPLSGLVNVNNVMMSSQNQSCLEVSYNDMIAQLQNITQTNDVGGRQWTWQTCTEFGYYQTTDAPANTQPFGMLQPLSYSLQICKDAFNFVPTEAQIDWTNTYFGSDSPAGTRILFVNGSLDPWHALSVLAPVSKSEDAIFITGTAHCANMHVWTPQYPESMRDAQVQIGATITNWLNE
eukprot:TRINITY_DN5658_c0_g1_i5.p1 TRINITY_DN5658_c0_g1~~TRINITY_DN5658_c0_g1_i5.p1  ORF type:complete len:479 (+),score=112.51 TRINITY_DN5658_c0_g1_i5:4030-5466(+)